MRKCVPEGELRAYLDGEGSPDVLASISEHLRECAACRESLERVGRRSEFVASLLGVLPEPEVAAPLEMPRAVPGRVRWAPVALALAACLAFVFVIRIATHGPSAPIGREPAQTASSAPAAARVAASEPPTAVEAPAQGNVTARVRPQRAKPRAPAKPRQDAPTFLALDNEPIEAALIMRVALGPEETPADVMFGPDGRARAIRLVSYSNGGQE
jgi:anti-sigma factor RsiW